MAKWRYYCQDAITGEFLHRELPLAKPEITYTLSGTGLLKFDVGPESSALRDHQFVELFGDWATIISPERNGRIRGSYIPVRSTFHNEAGTATVECISLSGYPTGIPFDDVIRGWAMDPYDVVRLIWAHVQSYNDGNLNMIVDSANSPKHVGSYQPPPKPERPKRANYKSKKLFDAARDQWEKEKAGWEDRYGDFEPYELVWWEKPDCGKEIDRLATESRFDYREHHEWNADKTTIIHRFQLGDPLFGRRRHDLAFREGENLTRLPEPKLDGETRANYVLGLGKGEGRRMRRVMVGQPDGRLRRVGVTTHKNVSRVSTLRTYAERQRRRAHADYVQVDSFVVRDHRNARLGSWGLGDEVLVETWSGLRKIKQWMRIIEWAEMPEDGDIGKITVAN